MYARATRTRAAQSAWRRSTIRVQEDVKRCDGREYSVQVKKASREAKELGLAVTVTRDQWFPDAPIITVTARHDGPLKSLLDFTVRVHDSMIASATLYFRCGTPSSEVRYEISLSEYVSINSR